MLLFVTIFTPLAMPSEVLPAETAPDTLEARFTVAIDPVARSFLRHVELGVGSTARAELALVWANTDGKVQGLDGDYNVPLPWRSPTTSFTIPANATDVQLLAA